MVENLDKLYILEKCKVFKGDSTKLIMKIGGEFDFIYVDPPYENQITEQLVRAILNKSLLGPNGVLVIERHTKTPTLDLSLPVKSYKYGISSLDFYSFSSI